MKRFSLSLFAAALAACLVSITAQEGALVDTSRELEASASGSGSGSGSASVSTCSSPGCLMLAEAGLIFAGLLIFLEGLVLVFVILAPILALLLAIWAIILIFFGILGLADPTARRQLKGGKSSKVDPALLDALGDILGTIVDITDLMIGARSDPNVGDALDTQICDLLDVADEVEDMMGGKSGKRRALKSGKSGKTGFYCPGGKSGKTYAPSVTGAPTYLKSGKSYTYAPTDMVYYVKSGKRKV